MQLAPRACKDDEARALLSGLTSAGLLKHARPGTASAPYTRSRQRLQVAGPLSHTTPREHSRVSAYGPAGSECPPTAAGLPHFADTWFGGSQ